MLRQTVIAMVKGAALGDHENPGEASIHVLAGRVRLSAGEHSGRAGMVTCCWSRLVPQPRGAEDAAVLLTVAKLP